MYPSPLSRPAAAAHPNKPNPPCQHRPGPVGPASNFNFPQTPSTTSSMRSPCIRVQRPNFSDNGEMALRQQQELRGFRSHTSKLDHKNDQSYWSSGCSSSFWFVSRRRYDWEGLPAWGLSRWSGRTVPSAVDISSPALEYNQLSILFVSALKPPMAAEGSDP